MERLLFTGLVEVQLATEAWLQVPPVDRCFAQAVKDLLLVFVLERKAPSFRGRCIHGPIRVAAAGSWL